MEPKRYWWIQYTEIEYDDNECHIEQVTDIHPFIHMDIMRKETESSIYILNTWKLISAEEYELFNTLNNNQ